VTWRHALKEGVTAGRLRPVVRPRDRGIDYGVRTGAEDTVPIGPGDIAVDKNFRMDVRATFAKIISAGGEQSDDEDDPHVPHLITEERGSSDALLEPPPKREVL
jgi:hypothetical protein